MNAAQHTPGRLNVAVEIFDNDGMPETVIQGLGAAASVAVALDFGANNPGMREANARRLVACWNASEGIDTEDLEAGSVNIIDKLHDDAARRLIAAAPDLLDALKECVEDSEQAVCEYIEKYGETYRPQRLQAMRNTVAKARAAIAKAGGAV